MFFLIMKVVSVEGIVIKCTPFKESSKILNVFTPEYGIIGVVSKGCKSIKSPNRLISENFAYGTFNLSYKENGLSTLINGDVKNYFINIKSNIVRYSYMSYLIKFVSEVYKESNESNLFDLLVNGLSKIEDGLNPKVICNIIELKCLEYLGIGLNVDRCAVCGNEKITTFSESKGGFVCCDCVEGECSVNLKVLKMLRMYKYIDINKISKIDISTDVIFEIDKILESYISEYSGINIKARNFLKNITS
ncbi:MAG: DNA repair protein RecO [Bacilli bacterium]|nr:DNA repair protein RecO [Bacilli bacterium]